MAQMVEALVLETMATEVPLDGAAAAARWVARQVRGRIVGRIK